MDRNALRLLADEFGTELDRASARIANAARFAHEIATELGRPDEPAPPPRVLLAAGPHDLPTVPTHAQVMDSFRITEAGKAVGLHPFAPDPPHLAPLTGRAGSVGITIGQELGDSGAVTGTGWFEGSLKLTEPLTAGAEVRFTATLPANPDLGEGGKLAPGLLVFDDRWPYWPAGNNRLTLRNASVRPAYARGADGVTRWQLYCYLGGDPELLRPALPDWIETGGRRVAWLGPPLVPGSTTHHRLRMVPSTLGGADGEVMWQISGPGYWQIQVRDVPWSVPAFDGDDWRPGIERMYWTTMAGGASPGPSGPRTIELSGIELLALALP